MVIGSLVGIAVFAIQMNRPGGERGMSEAAWKALPSGEGPKKRLQFYTAYLTRIHHPAEDVWVRAESAAGMEARDVIKRGFEGSPMGITAMSRLFDDWVVSMVLLANALEMLILCAALFALKALRRDTGAAPAIVVGIICALFVMVAWRAEWIAAMGAVRQVLTNLSESDTAPSLPQSFGQVAAAQIFASPILGRIAIAGLSLSVPFLTVAILGISGLIPRKGERSVLVTGLCGGGTVICLASALLYAVAVSATTREEDVQNQTLDRMVQHTGPYLAELRGKTWPPLK